MTEKNQDSLWDAMGKVGFRSGPSAAAEGEDLCQIPDAGNLKNHPYVSFLASPLLPAGLRW